MTGPGTAAIVGVADTEVGRLPHTTTFDLTAAAAAAALDDAGMGWSELDGLITAEPLIGAFSRHAVSVAEALGIAEQLEHCATVKLGGASPLAGLVDAFRLVETGVCRAVLLVAADTPRTGQERQQSVATFASMRHPAWERPFGMLNVSAYGLLAQAYLDRYSLEQDALSVIPVAMREHARTNPTASYRDPLPAADVVASRMVSSPLRLLECSPISDGGGAVVVTAAGRNGSGRRAVRLLGAAQGYVYDNVAYAGDLSRTGCRLSAARALSRAGAALSDVDVALLYDSYSITLAVELEEIGFCAPGEATGLVGDGGISLSGEIPVNPHGGLLSHAHCGGAAGIQHITEAVRQLSGDAVNQVVDASTALVHAEGGIISANCTALLAR